VSAIEAWIPFAMSGGFAWVVIALATEVGLLDPAVGEFAGTVVVVLLAGTSVGTALRMVAGHNQKKPGRGRDAI